MAACYNFRMPTHLLNFFRSHPLFTIDDRANFLLENNRSVAQGSKWEEDEEGNTDLDCNEIFEDVYNEKNEAYKVFQLARHVRELAKNITDGMYYVKDMDVLKEVSALLIDAHKKLMSTKTPSGFPELKGQDL